MMPSTESDISLALRTERSRLCDLLDELDAEVWSRQSLCDDWNLHEVVAHLSLSARTSVLDFVKGMVRYRGNFDRMEAERAGRRAQDFAPGELIEQLRSDIESTKTAPGSSPIDALTDFVIHSQDIAIPLGVNHPVAPEHTVMALEHVRSSRWYGAKKRIGAARLRASDVDWTGGAGATTISGTALDLLLAASGRPAGLPGLTGDGVPLLRAALEADPQHEEEGQ